MSANGQRVLSQSKPAIRMCFVQLVLKKSAAVLKDQTGLGANTVCPARRAPTFAKPLKSGWTAHIGNPALDWSLIALSG